MLTIYKASAGSGKTYKLTYSYIKLLLGYKDESGSMRLRKNPRSSHRSILAVTFTNKATDEMKRRIIHELAVLAAMEPKWKKKSPYEKDLMAELGCSAEELKHSARSALMHLLFDFNFFQVSTIDSFFQLILRTFAREAELTGNYEVDLENDRAMESGVRNLFDSLKDESRGADNARMVNWLTEFLLNELKEGHGVALFNRRSGAFTQLLDFVRRTDTEVFKRGYEDMMKYLSSANRLEKFRQQLASAPGRHGALTKKACADALALIESRGYSSGKRKVAATVVKLLQVGEVNGYDTAKTPGKTLEAVTEDIGKAYNAELRNRLVDCPDPELDSAIAAAMLRMKEGRTFRPLWYSLSKQLYSLGMLSDIYGFIDSFRAENNSLLLSDTNSILKEIIGEGDTPFVFERLGVWLNHFLIDEFQDTSLMQWEIMKPLVEQGQSVDADSLIIGDEKQCIYRFRSSDPTLLQYQVTEQFREKATVEGDTPEDNTNWRSSRHVVEFNNMLFQSLSRRLGLSEIYANVCQLISDKHAEHNGYVCVRQIEAPAKDGFITLALDGMVEEMRRQLRSGYKGKELAVLVRSKREGAAVIERLSELMAADVDFRGLRVISDDAMTLSAAPAVRLIVSVLHYLQSLTEPAPDEMTGNSARRRQLAEINRMINRYEYGRSRGLRPEEALTRAVDGDDRFDIRDDVGVMTCFNLPSLVERVVSRMFTSEELDRECMFISAFQDTVIDFCSSGNSDLQSFLDWWDSKGRNVTVSAPYDENAIRVMTIHKSKGLEFRCVHVPTLSAEMISFGDNEWFAKESIPFVDDELVPPLLSIRPGKQLRDTAFLRQYDKLCRDQMLDELNVLYVALTRATDELCIGYYNTTRNSDNIPVGMLLSSCLPDMSVLKYENREALPEGVEIYSYGRPTVALVKEADTPTALDPKEVFFMPPYHTADRSDLWSHTKVDDLPDFSRARDRGIILHDVLSRVYNADGLSKAVAASVHSGLLPLGDAPDIRRFLEVRLRQDDVSSWFSGFSRIAVERPILLEDGKTVRPDRVVWTADGHVDVVDYKFGGEYKKYERQVSNYVNMLRAMGERNVRGFLWYLDSGKVKEVPDK